MTETIGSILLVAMATLKLLILFYAHRVSRALRADVQKLAPGWGGIAHGVALILLACALISMPLRAAETIRVPPQAAMYRLWVDQAVTEQWGVNASSARLAAQLHQESLWQPKARSRAGAVGIAQFMPATAEWIAQRFPQELGQFDPWDPRQGIRAAAIYDRFLYDRVTGASECDRWAFTLSAYNGGLGWISRDKNRASASGADPARWFGHVEAHSARAEWAFRENRGYVSRILLRLEPAYIAAGWPGEAVCP